MPGCQMPGSGICLGIAGPSTADTCWVRRQRFYMVRGVKLKEVCRANGGVNEGQCAGRTAAGPLAPMVKPEKARVKEASGLEAARVGEAGLVTRGLLPGGKPRYAVSVPHRAAQRPCGASRTQACRLVPHAPDDHRQPAGELQGYPPFPCFVTRSHSGLV
jgi:hypothetical protein